MHSFASAAMLNSQQAAGEQLGLGLSVWAARDAWVQVSVSDARSCKSETSVWRELKAWCSVPINSTVYCQRCSTGISHQFKRMILVKQGEMCGVNPNQSFFFPFWAGSIWVSLQSPFLWAILIGAAQGVKIVLSQKETKELLICGLGHHLIVSPL